MSQQNAKPTMSSSSATWLAWYMCVLSLALTALSLFLLALNLSHPGIHIYEPWYQHSVIAVAFSTVGAVIVSRRSETTVGWIFCTIGLLAGVVHLSSAYAVYALLAEPGSLPGGEVAAWMRSWDWVPYLGLFVFLFVLFPDGRAQSNRWRWFARLVGVVVFVGTILAAYSPGPIDAIGPVENPLGIELLEVVDANAAVGPVETLLFTLGLIAVVSLFARMRRAREVERQQLKWFAYATAVLLSGTILAYTIAEATNAWWVWWGRLHTQHDRACRSSSLYGDSYLTLPTLRDRPHHQQNTRLRRAHRNAGCGVLRGYRSVSGSFARPHRSNIPTRRCSFYLSNSRPL